jgi:RNA polymerase sigma-70 factor (ECF subfamily)
VPLDPDAPEPAATGSDPEQEALLADSISLALLIVLETLTPAERVCVRPARTCSGVSFEEIAPVVGPQRPRRAQARQPCATARPR